MLQILDWLKNIPIPFITNFKVYFDLGNIDHTDRRKG